MKKLVIVLLILIGVTCSVLYRASTFYSDQQYYSLSTVSPLTLDKAAVISRLSQSIQIATISNDEDSTNIKAFSEFHRFLEMNFPLIHQTATRHIINEQSLIFEFGGKNSSLKPVLFMGHMDVVPVGEDTLSQWKHPPFSGVVANDQIWGRGTIDDKSTIMALMEAMEMHLSSGMKPQRTLYFSFGHDEEIGGENGAKAAADFFKKREIKFEFVLDEGGAIVDGILAGFEQQIALIGIAEKGFVNIRLSVDGEGGHSSMPPNHTAAGILAKAIVNLEDSSFPADLKFTNLIFNAIGHYADFGTRTFMANQWLTKPLIKASLLKQPSSAASLRTTTAVTMLKGSSKSNILPTRASAVANFRIFPGETWESVLKHVEKSINDPRVKLEAFMKNNPSPISDHQSPQFELLEQTIREISPDTLVAPYLVQGGTDAKYFYELSDQIYRFSMIRLTTETLKTIHGINERNAIEDYLNSVQYFHQLLRKAAQKNE